MPKVRDINALAQRLAMEHEAAFFVVCVPYAGGLQVALAATPAEAVKFPPLLRHLADEMEKTARQNAGLVVKTGRLQ